jgi:trehalose-phosphatase
VNVPVHLFRVWEKVVRRLAHPERVALFTDFDGTLAPICSRPSDARMLAGTRPLLAACAKQVALTGVVSGRRLLDVRRRVGVSGAWYAGVHGYALVSPRNRRFLLLNRVERERIAYVASRLSQALSGLNGIRVEHKEAAVAVHYRGASIASRHTAGRLVRSLSAESPDLRLMLGRKVWEFLPAGEVNKASAIRFILQRERLRRALVFLGDDVTDETVFREMRGVMVLVGKRRHTAARYWLRSPSEVRQFLERCLRLWE